MRMEDIEVYTGEKGHVVLKQSSSFEDDHIILLHPEQVELVCQWMKEAAQKAKEID